MTPSIVSPVDCSVASQMPPGSAFETGGDGVPELLEPPPPPPPQSLRMTDKSRSENARLTEEVLLIFPPKIATARDYYPARICVHTTFGAASIGQIRTLEQRRKQSVSTK
jgi:hypothetical protein